MKKIKWRNGWTLTIMEKGETLNRNGRPRKLFSDVNEELKKKGIKPLDKAQYIEWLGLIYNADEEELQELEKNKDIPYSLRLMIWEIKDEKTRSNALKDYRDYIFGKAKEEVRNTNTNINLDLQNKENLKEILKNNNLI